MAHLHGTKIFFEECFPRSTPQRQQNIITKLLRLFAFCAGVIGVSERKTSIFIVCYVFNKGPVSILSESEYANNSKREQ